MYALDNQASKDSSHNTSESKRGPLNTSTRLNTSVLCSRWRGTARGGGRRRCGAERALDETLDGRGDSRVADLHRGSLVHLEGF